jgi:GT2 family glycosyltransferase
VRVSVAIAALNEGLDLEATIALLDASKTRPCEVIVYDDGSVVPVEDRLAKWSPWCRVMRSDRRLGSGPAKHLAADACTGDAVVIMDAHMRPPWDWIDLLVAEHEKNPGAILCARSTGYESASEFDGQGADLKMEAAGFWEPKWALPTMSRKPRNVPCVYGGLYFMPRTVMRAVGGYAPAYMGWGCEEEYLSLRAWITGHSCRLVPSLVVPHQYVRPVNRTDSEGNEPIRWETQYNRHVAAVVCFGEVSYTRYYARSIPLPRDCADALLSRQSEIHAAMKHIAANRTIDDQELSALCGVVHSTE